jgi:hypothetical protein
MAPKSSVTTRSLVSSGLRYTVVPIGFAICNRKMQLDSLRRQAKRACTFAEMTRKCHVTDSAGIRLMLNGRGGNRQKAYKAGSAHEPTDLCIHAKGDVLQAGRRGNVPGG